MNNTKKIIGIVAITLLLATAVVGAGSAGISNTGLIGGSYTFFNYQYVYDNDVLTPGNYSTKDGSASFSVPYITTQSDFYIPGNQPAGIYYLNGNEKNVSIYIKPISTSYVSDSFGTKVIGDEVIVTTQNPANLTPFYVIKKNGEGSFLAMFPSGQILWDGKLIREFPNILKPYVSNKKDIGTWKVYVTYLDGVENYLTSANGTINISGNGILDKFGAFYNKAPEDARFLEIGTLKIVSTKNHGMTVSVISNTDEPEIVEPSNPPVEVTVSISGASTLKVGDTILFSATNSDDSSAKFSWKSSNDSVVTVDENGNVKALKAGTATITVTNPEIGKSESKIITVAAKGDSEQKQTTKSPFPILGIIAGLGIACVLVMRRKL